MAHFNDTQFIRLPGMNGYETPNRMEASEVLKQVYAALREKGYNPVTQIVGYIMSGDPTYITYYQNARSLIMKAERDELLSELVEHYIKTAL